MPTDIEAPVPPETRKEEDEARSEELRKAVEAKRALRRANTNPERPDSTFFRSLDSSIKRNTAVIKKLKLINEEQREGLLEELKSVNLSKFVTEAVNAICDAKLKSSDINAAVQICSLLHQRYKEFSANLVQGLVKVFLPAKGVEDGDGSSRALKKRSTLKLLLELYYCGVTDDTSSFVTIVKDLASIDHLKDRETSQTNLSLLVSFVRQGRYLFGLPMGNQDAQGELYKDLTISPEHKRQLKRLIQSFYDAAVDVLLSEHTGLRQAEQDNARTLNSKGELSEENAAAYEKLRKSYDHLLRNVSALAEALDIPPPVMPEDTNTTRVLTTEGGAVAPAAKEPVSEPVWDDEDTRTFYENLQDLRAFVPAVLLGESEPSKPSDQAEAEPSGDTAAAATETENGVPEEKEKEKEKLKEKERDEPETRKEHDKEKLKFYGDGGNLDELLQRLPRAVSRDLIDQLTVDFCYLNSKSNRKRLVRTLFNVPRTSLELLPYYSRMVATLSTCMRDIGPMLVQMLEDEFNFLINKKDQMNIETKIKNIRFLGELAKFKVSQPSLIFTCLKSCLDDFSHHNIDVACNLLESCGRFLYRSPETSYRMSTMLETFARLKNVKNLDARHSMLVENAYYQCKPPEKSARVTKQIPELHQYIRKLVLGDMDRLSIDQVSRQLRKLPWDECEHYVVKCFMKVHKVKYSQVHLLASLVAVLSRYHDTLAVAVVDEVLEEIRVGLEVNDFGMQQRRIAFMRFLGELYSYKLVDGCIIFETLYLVIFFGEGTPEQDVLDPPEDFFRVRLVMTLLGTCGQFFDRGPSRRKLDRFLLFFQRYVLSKGPTPLDIEFDLQDMFGHLRPSMMRYTTVEDAHQALLEMEEAIEYPPHAEYAAAHMSSEGVVGENGADELESDTQSSELHEDEEDEDGSDDDEDDTVENAPGSEEDDHVQLRLKSKEVDPAEDAEFEKELRAMVQEGKMEASARKTPNIMTIPLNLEHGRSMDVESGEETEGSSQDVTFRVVLKKGNKPQWKQMPIPRDSTLVQRNKQKEAAELEEKQDIKRLVLEYNEREVDERAAASAQQLNWASQMPVITSRGMGGRGGYQRRPPGSGYGYGGRTGSTSGGRR